MKMYDNKRCVLLANKKLVQANLVHQQFGNVSIRVDDVIIIKPSGIDLSSCEIEDMSVVDFYSANLLSGKKPSTDTPTHLVLYQRFEAIKSIIHTHSLYATAWAQANLSIPCMGTTHADYWAKEVMVTQELNETEIAEEYEMHTGELIIKKFEETKTDVYQNPGILVAHHGPFTWGKTVEEAVKNAEQLEYIAKLAWMTLQLNPHVTAIPSELHRRHYSRKQGPEAYYGQEKT